MKLKSILGTLSKAKYLIGKLLSQKNGTRYISLKTIRLLSGSVIGVIGIVVPGLIINGNLLEMSPDGSGGIMVGTKTSYVQGKYMKEAGIGRYRDVVRTELEKRVEEAFK